MTKEVKHTPGPWKFVLVPRQDHEDGSVTFPHFRVDGDGFEGIYTDTMLPVGPDEREANARLISAAPDLLEAAQEALDELILCWGASIIDTDTKRAIDGLRKAIAKARGE